MSCGVFLRKVFCLRNADEATSALDATSRILVFEAIKRWRRNKTTIVITHDLSQISPADFAYVLREGEVVECGYRADLEVAGGEFQQMSMTQAEAGGFAVKEESESSTEAARRRDEDAEKILGSQCVQSPSVRAASSTRARESSPSLSVTGCSTSSRILLEVARQPHQMPQSLSGIRHTWVTSYPWKRSPAISLLYHANAALPPSPLVCPCRLLLTPPPRAVSLHLFPTSPAYNLSNSSIVGNDDKRGLNPLGHLTSAF